MVEKFSSPEEPVVLEADYPTAEFFSALEQKHNLKFDDYFKSLLAKLIALEKAKERIGSQQAMAHYITLHQKGSDNRAFHVYMGRAIESLTGHSADKIQDEGIRVILADGARILLGGERRSLTDEELLALRDQQGAPEEGESCVATYPVVDVNDKEKWLKDIIWRREHRQEDGSKIILSQGVLYNATEEEENISRIIEEIERERAIFNAKIKEAMRAIGSAQVALEKSAKQVEKSSVVLDEALKVIEDFSIREERLKIRALTDGLTGLLNPKGMYRRLREIKSSLERKIIIQASMAFLDLDFFKTINDDYGHQAGDEALKQFVKIITKEARDEDVLVRYGGDEFVIISPGYTKQELATLAQRIGNCIARNGITLANGTVLDVSVSVGIASFKANRSIDQLMQEADEAMYYTKEKGKNGMTIDKEFTPFFPTVETSNSIRRDLRQ